MLANYFSWITIGCMIGWVISQILPARHGGHAKPDIIMGAASAFGTGILMQIVIQYPVNEFSPSLLVISILGAIVALATHRTFART